MNARAGRASMSPADLEAFFAREFPQLAVDGRHYVVEETGQGSATLRLKVAERHLRPGGTVSGPAMMTLADLALYSAILATVGPVALAVTTNLSFNFLRRPPAADLLGRARLLKVGRRLAVGEVAIVGEGTNEILCHATGTYSIPPPAAP